MADLALLSNVTPRVVNILNANNGLWTSAVTGDVGAFPTLDEITAAIVEADGVVITRGYFNSINNSLAQRFIDVTDALPKGAQVPEHYGNTSKVELSASTLTGIASGTDVNTGTNVITKTAHGLATGDAVSMFSSTTMPSGVTAHLTYYAIVLTSSTFQLATSAANAANGTAVVLGSTGSGDHTVIKWQEGIETDTADDIKQAIAVMSSYVGETDAYAYLYKIENNILYHATNWGRVEIPVYVRQFSPATLQANKADEPIIVALAVALLMKHASPALFMEWSQKADIGIQQLIRDGSYQPTNPDMNP